ncbi:MAG: Ig-like domain repeat protein [Methanobrevibacter sp.]|nr:Ig-like domain repeat protein [Methanobrevibacter sp.]
MNKKILIFSLIILAVISIGSVAAANEVSDDGTVINVDNTMSNDEIQAQLDTVTDNSVINFAAGEYNNVSLKITKDYDVTEEVNQTDDNGTVTLVNQTKTIKTTLNNITINGNGAVLRGSPAMSNYYDGIFEVANVNGFTLSGFNFICEGVKMANMKTPSCVIIFNTSNGIIEDNNISGGRFGLYVGSKFTNPNYDTIVRNNVVTGVSDMGIISFGSARTHIYNNTVINPVNHGIDVRHNSGPNCIVENNTVIGAREGIYLMHSAGHKAINNILNNCDIGITCYGSSNILCDKNNFTNNTKIGFLLSSGYKNIQIGEENDYSGLVFVPMPPTFTYNIVKGDADYVAATNGTFSQGDYNKNTYIVVSVLDKDGEQVNLENGATTVITDDTISYYNNVTVKVWRNYDNNHIEAGEVINVTIDGVDYSGISDFTGAVYVNAAGLGSGKHYVSVKYPGNENLSASTWSGIIQIGSEETKMTVQDITITTTTSKALTVTLKDTAGNILANKEIQYTLNGKTYTTQTNAKGVATVKASFSSAGTRYYTFTFLGDDNHKASMATAKVTVKKTQLSKSTFAKQSFKVKATKKVKVTFKDAKGTALKSKKVTLTVNGKTYTATTNSNGVATFTVKLTAKKNYAATAKYAGDSKYFAKNLKQTIVVK